MLKQTTILRICGLAHLFRKKVGISPEEPISIFDALLSNNLRVLFEPLGDDDGLLIDNSSQIFVKISTKRPHMRQRFSAAHELGHLVFRKNGVTFTRPDDEEIAANFFAGEVLAPRTVIQSGLRLRSLQARELDIEHCFAMACWLGLSFSALLTQFSKYRFIEGDTADTWKKIPARKIWSLVSGVPVEAPVILVDEYWHGRPVDALTDEILLLPHSAGFHYSGGSETTETDKGVFHKLLSPGVGTIHIQNKNLDLRVRDKNFTGKGEDRYRRMQ